MNVYIWTEKPLMSYAEIVAMATSEWYPWTNTIAELNSDWLWYYNKLDSEWHLTDTYFSWYGTFPAIDWISERDDMKYRRIMIPISFGGTEWETARSSTSW